MRKNKKITVYALEVIMKDGGEFTLTLAATKQDASEYAHLWLRNALLDEYKSWAEELDLDWEAWNTWHFFYNLEVSSKIKEAIRIKKLTYRFKDLLSVLRMFGGCQPLGASFESSLEDEYFNAVNSMKVDTNFEKVWNTVDNIVKIQETEENDK